MGFDLITAQTICHSENVCLDVACKSGTCGRCSEDGQITLLSSSLHNEVDSTFTILGTP
jgi:hypothetical protein